MKRRFFLASGSAAIAAGYAPADAIVLKTSLRDKLKTRAESTDFTESSSYADVQTFLGELAQRGAPIVRGSLGMSAGGRDIPYVIASRPVVHTPEEARALKRPIVLVWAAVNGGHVEGKEASLALLRDLCVSTEKTLLEDVVLLLVPMYNPDGSERLGSARTNQPDENGPPRVGEVQNGDGLDLAVDFVKAEAPETRAALAFVRKWNPDAFVDLQTSGPSFSTFALTIAPALHPGAFYGGGFARDRVFPAVQKEMHEKFGFELFSDGHFGRARPLAVPPAATDAEFGWFPGDYRARNATNYMGLRGAVSVLVRANAHDPLERRIYTTRACLESVLGYCSDNDDDVLANARTASHWLGGKVPIRAALPARPSSYRSMEWDVLALDASPDGEPGVPVGYKRTGMLAGASMPIYDRYADTLAVPQPRAYLIPYEFASKVKPLLHVHGIAYDTGIATQKIRVQDYVLDRVDRASFPYEKRHLVSVEGHWREARSFVAKFGALTVPAMQEVGPLLSVLLEPQSDDGFLVWDAFDGALVAESPAPVLRVV